MKSAFTQIYNLYKATISMQNKLECVAWGVTGICQLFKEPLVHSVTARLLHISFSCWNSIHRQMALGNSETGESETKVEVQQTTPPTYACALCHLELGAALILDSEVLGWCRADVLSIHVPEASLCVHQHSDCTCELLCKAQITWGQSSLHNVYARALSVVYVVMWLW